MLIRVWRTHVSEAYQCGVRVRHFWNYPMSPPLALVCLGPRLLVRDRVCARIRVRFPLSLQSVFLDHNKTNSFGCLRVVHTNFFLFLKSVSERDGSDIQQLWYWMTTLKCSVLIFCTVYNFWFFVNSHQKILNQLSGLEMIDSPKMNAEQKFPEKIFFNGFN